MQSSLILKLGGSIITNKSGGKPTLNKRLVRRAALEIAKDLSARPRPLILLYGAGSFAHPLAYRYKLSERPLTKQSLIGAGLTISAVRELGTRLAEVFLKAGLPIIPLQVSAFATMRAGKLSLANLSLIEHILASGGVPLLGGDVVIADGRRTAIASADALAALLGKHVRARRILFATDVDGVYRAFPPRRGERALSEINRKQLRNMLKKHVSKTSARDVTGAMEGKLRALLPLRRCEVVIFNATKAGALADVLRGKTRGTTVVL